MPRPQPRTRKDVANLIPSEHAYGVSWYRKPGLKYVLYRTTAPCLLRAGRGQSRWVRLDQLKQDGSLKVFVENLPDPEPYLDLPSDEDEGQFNFDVLMGFEQPHCTTKKVAKKPEITPVLGRANVEYVSPFEYEHQKIEAMKAGRGGIPRHLDYDAIFEHF